MIKLAAAESLLLAGLVMLSSSALRRAVSASEPPRSSLNESVTRLFGGYGMGEAALSVLLVAVLYWFLHWRGRGRFAFRLTALVTLLPHAPAVWSLNRLELYRFFGFDVSVTAFSSTMVDVTGFLATLVGLAAVHRVAGIRRMDRQMSSQGITDSERSRVVLGEAMMLLGLTAAALLLSALLVLLAALAERVEALLDWSPWTVLFVGVGGAITFASTLVLWFRAQRDASSTG